MTWKTATNIGPMNGIKPRMILPTIPIITRIIKSPSLLPKILKALDNDAVNPVSSTIIITNIKRTTGMSITVIASIAPTIEAAIRVKPRLIT